MTASVTLDLPPSRGVASAITLEPRHARGAEAHARRGVTYRSRAAVRAGHGGTRAGLRQLSLSRCGSMRAQGHTLGAALYIALELQTAQSAVAHARRGVTYHFRAAVRAGRRGTRSAWRYISPSRRGARRAQSHTLGVASQITLALRLAQGAEAHARRGVTDHSCAAVRAGRRSTRSARRYISLSRCGARRAQRHTPGVAL